MPMREKKLLLIHHGALGDFVLGFPALHLLRRQYRSIDAVCQNKLGKLAVYLNIIDDHFPLESAMTASLFSDRMHPHLKRILESYGDVVLFSFSEPLEALIRRQTTPAVYRVAPRPEPEETVHVAAHLLQGLKRAGLITDATPPERSLASPAGQKRQDSGYDPSHLILHPGSGSPRKNWPLAQYIRLADMLGKKGKRATFFCGPAERDMVSAVRASGHAVHASDDLVELADRMITAGGFIGNDSGLCHLSAFLGVSTIAVFGPSDPQRWRPIGLSASVVRAEPICRPCFESTKNRCPSPDCLKNISPSQVLAAFDELIRSRSGSDPFQCAG